MKIALKDDVECFFFDGNNLDEFKEFMGREFKTVLNGNNKGRPMVATPEAVKIVFPNTYVVRFGSRRYRTYSENTFKDFFRVVE